MNELNDDFNDYHTISTRDDMTMLKSIDHKGERSSDDLPNLTSDQIFIENLFETIKNCSTTLSKTL